jgi:hypothetical protein
MKMIHRFKFLLLFSAPRYQYASDSPPMLAPRNASISGGASKQESDRDSRSRRAWTSGLALNDAGPVVRISDISQKKILVSMPSLADPMGWA